MKKDEQIIEGITIESEKKIKNVSTIIMIIIIFLGILVTLDIILVAKLNIGPFLAINTKTYNDGGTKEYYGLGYKIIKYNQKIGRRDTVIGSWTTSYNTNPNTYTITELSYSIINDNNNHLNEFIRLTGTVAKKDLENNTITLKYLDEGGKYNLTVNVKLLSQNIKELNLNAPVSLIGTITKYNENKKIMTIINAFAE